jgi:hypothetical protein
MFPREASAFVASRAEHVKIDPDAVAKVAPVLLSLLRDSNFCSNYSRAEVHPDPEHPGCVDWVFLVSTLNFCFWYDDDGGEDGSGDRGSASSYSVEFGGKTYTGYFALCAALKRAVEEGIDVTNPSFYAQVRFSLDPVEPSKFKILTL